MIEAVILHCPSDAEPAKRIAGAWPNRAAVTAEVAADMPVYAFGRHLFVCGVWTGATNDAGHASAMALALAGARRKAALLVWPELEAPDALSQLGAPLVTAAGEPARDALRLSQLASDIESGRYIAPSAPPAARRSVPGFQRRAAPEKLARPQRLATAASVGPDPVLRRRRNGVVGFALGALVGAGLFFWFAAPRISAWLAERQGVPPPQMTLAPTPAAAAAPAAQASPAGGDQTPLRGLTRAEPYPPVASAP